MVLSCQQGSCCPLHSHLFLFRYLENTKDPQITDDIYDAAAPAPVDGDDIEHDVDSTQSPPRSDSPPTISTVRVRISGNPWFALLYSRDPAL